MFTAGNSSDETMEPGTQEKTPRDRAIDQLGAMFLATTGRKLPLTEVAEFVDDIIEAAKPVISLVGNAGGDIPNKPAKTKGEQP